MGKEGEPGGELRAVNPAQAGGETRGDGGADPRAGDPAHGTPTASGGCDESRLPRAAASVSSSRASKLSSLPGAGEGGRGGGAVGCPGEPI